MQEEIKEIQIEKIETGENMRIGSDDLAELMTSIRVMGLLQPIRVQPIEKEKYKIVFGNRRFDACRKLGYKTISAIIEKEKLTQREFLEKNFTENYHSNHPSDIEFGKSINGFISDGMTASEISARLGISKTKVSQCKRLFDEIPENLKNQIKHFSNNSKKEGKLSGTITKSIMSAKKQYQLNDAETNMLFKYAKEDNFSVRQMGVFSKLVSGGMTPIKALEEINDYRGSVVSFYFRKTDLREALENNKAKNLSEMINHFCGKQLNKQGIFTM